MGLKQTGAPATPKVTSKTLMVPPSVPIGRNHEDVQIPPQLMPPDTSALAVAVETTALRRALEHRSARPLSPYQASEWALQLDAANLTVKYSNLAHMFNYGFHAGLPTIISTYTPPNNTSVLEHYNELVKAINLEFSKGRYLGPASKAQIEEILGPFQSSPLSIIPKPNKPGKFRIIQNFSHPHAPSKGISSINSAILSDQYPCTWGTFGTISLLLETLPPGSEGAVRDVKEAYRTVPFHPSHWPATVVRLPGKDLFAIDTQNAFGLASGGGVYGNVADAGADLMRAHGLGPVSKWVDDHLFLRVPLSYLDAFNKLRQSRAQTIKLTGGLRHSKGRLWFRGDDLDNGMLQEFDEDHSFPIQNRSLDSPRSAHDATFSYAFQDIDEISHRLGIPWEREKDSPFAPTFTFIGLAWSLISRSVTLPLPKRQKYQRAIEEWECTKTHTLNDAQKLHGKLLHATLVLTRGRPYLINIEAFLGVFHDTPFKPHTPSKHLASDLSWWKTALSTHIERPLQSSVVVEDLHAFSDASSEVGIGIVIGARWRAWRLVPGWNTPGTGRDIGWAEAMGFYFLAATIADQRPGEGHYRLFGDNMGVVEGWWRGRSRNRPTNDIFKLVGELGQLSNSSFYTRYVQSALNPADDPSRGIYGPLSLLLPATEIPRPFRDFIVDFDHPQLPIERSMAKQGAAPSPKQKPPRDPTRSTRSYALDRQAEETAARSAGW